LAGYPLKSAETLCTVTVGTFRGYLADHPLNITPKIFCDRRNLGGLFGGAPAKLCCCLRRKSGDRVLAARGYPNSLGQRRPVCWRLRSSMLGYRETRNLQNMEIRNLETCDFESGRKIFYQYCDCLASTPSRRRRKLAKNIFDFAAVSVADGGCRSCFVQGAFFHA